MIRAAALLGLVLLAAAPARAGGRAMVETIDILVAESFPVQIVANLRGYLSDACTRIAEVRTRGPENRRFRIEIVARRPPGAICAQVLTPFARSVPLDVYGLAAGTYQVTADGARAEFTLHRDNVPQ